MTVPWPQLTVVVVVRDATDPATLRSLASLGRQTVDDWRLLIVRPGGASAPAPRPLAGVPGDRIRHVAAEDLAAAVVIDAVETEYVAVLPPGSWLEPHAVAEVLAAIAEAGSEPDIVYSDLDLVDEVGIPARTLALPDWSPQLLRGMAYLQGLVVLRSASVVAAGDGPLDDGADWADELALRLSPHAPRVLHLRTVLLHRPQGAPGGGVSARRLSLVARQYDRMGADAVLRGDDDGLVHATLVPRPASRHPGHARASIVIPTRGGMGMVAGQSRRFVVEAVRSIVGARNVTEFELVVVHDLGADSSYLRELESLAGDRVRVVEFEGPFNFSAKVNLGAAHAVGDVLVLLNDDVEVLGDGWLDQLVGYAGESDVGAVGAKLLFEDGSIQHAGLMLHRGEFQHVGFHLPDTPGPRLLNVIDREVTGVTAACLAIRREVWDLVGGMDETLPNNFNDVDLCWRLRRRGLRVVQANSVVLHHFESMTREPTVAGWEADWILGRLGDELEGPDPFTFPEPGEAVSPGRRDMREWARVAREVWRTEGAASFARKARGRVRRLA